MTGPKRLGRARRVVVAAGRRGAPVAVRGMEVDSVLEEWVVEDRWWTDRPVRRRYFEVVLTDGRCSVVFFDMVRREWHSQRD